ncbi:MAG: Hpt domain-containing protein [Novosphingobium sp.]|jgi:two-component system chemotaxis sensor kinase CheA|nr:Hpt domain-containing protein [Novosphingobium sp.]
MDDLIAEFIAESREMLAALERGLVAWERDPGDRALLDEIFRFVHTVKGNCGFFDLPRLEALAHAAEDALGQVRAGQRAIDSRLVDAVLAVIDRIGEMVEQVAAGDDIAGGNDGVLIAMLGAIEPEPVLAEATPTAAGEGRPARVIEAQRSVRLPTSLVDRVMSGVSDMILVRNELERQLRLNDGDPALLANFGRLSSLLAEMQAAMAQVRMQPIGTLLGSYQRMVRDLAAELGKQVDLEIESGQVELDREMIELLRDPLLHIVRNAIDHGLETPAERTAAGKRATGRLMLSARQTGNEIRIAITDDGRGIDADRVVERAIARGAITAEQAARLERDQRLALICEPGLSTAREVTAISGRGVGMDVVRASIERIGGKLKILSTPGEGTRFLLDVPLTLSIVPSITAVVGGQVFALPRSYVREIVRNGAEIEVEPIGGVRHVAVRGELHPCLNLADLFGLPGETDPDRQTLVMIKLIDGAVFALCVDGIADHCDLVIRPVARQVIATGLYVGVAQLNDGTPALMLDISGISRLGGLSHDQQSRLQPVEATVEEQDQRELTTMIVFAGLDGVRRAVAMDLVERLVEVPRDKVGRSGGQPHAVFGDTIVPLHGLTDHFDADYVDVLVINAGSGRFAQTTAGSVDTADIDLATASGKPGSRLALLEGLPVELLEPVGDTTAARLPLCRLPLGDGWCRQVLKPLLEEAGYQVTADPDCLVDVEVTINVAASDEALPTADEVQVIAPGRAVSMAATLGRDDPAAVLAAVRALGGARGQ